MILAMWGNGMWYGDKTWLCHYVIHNIGKGWEGNETIRLHDIYWILMRMKRDWNLDLIPMTHYQSQQFVKLKMIWYNYRISTTAVVNLIIAGIYCTYKDLAYLFDFHEIHTPIILGFLGFLCTQSMGNVLWYDYWKWLFWPTRLVGVTSICYVFDRFYATKQGSYPSAQVFFCHQKAQKASFSRGRRDHLYIIPSGNLT